jgi:putative tryptophan/tyrosine transport system substrate-binding protein
MSRVGFLWNPNHPDNELPEAERAAASLGVELKPFAVRGQTDFDAAFAAAAQARIDALYVVTSRLTLAGFRQGLAQVGYVENQTVAIEYR